MKSITLSGQEQALYEALAYESQDLASMYIGALYVLQQDANPDRYPLAAHGFREIMEKLPRYRNLPISKGASMGDKVNGLRSEWEKNSKKTQCLNDGKWSGEIDKWLSNILTSVQNFFLWAQSERPNKRVQTAQMLKGLDPSPFGLPDNLGEIRVVEWNAYFDFFVEVSHHKKLSSSDDFERIKYHCEKFLLDRLKPRTFENEQKISSLIKEGEENDNA